MNTGKGTLTAFATSPGKTADDNPTGTNGLFTYHLVKAIKEPGLSLDQVFHRVRERVYSDSTQQQLPWTVSSVIGEFYFQPPAGGLAKLMSNVVPQTQTTAPRVERQTQQTPVQATPPPVAQDTAPLIDVARNAYGRNDFQQAITKSQEALRIEGNNKDALMILASSYFRIMQFDAFVGPAVQAVKAGAEVPFLLGHHHLLTGLHASSVKISSAGIAFDPMGAQACNQRAVLAPWTSLLNAALISNANKEQFLHMRFQGEANKVRNFNFADAESRVDTTKGVPIVLPTARSQQMLNAIARVLQQLKQ